MALTESVLNVASLNILVLVEQKSKQCMWSIDVNNHISFYLQEMRRRRTEVTVELRKVSFKKRRHANILFLSFCTQCDT